MTYMANTRNVRETSESRGQVARRLYQEALRAEARVQMEEDIEEVLVRQAIQRVGLELQDFIIEKNLTRKKLWREIIVVLEKHLEEEEEADKIILEKETVRQLIIESIRGQMREEFVRKRAVASRAFKMSERNVGRECFVCGTEGHIARFCDKRKGNWDDQRENSNNKDVNYFCANSFKSVVGKVDNVVESRKRKKQGLDLETVVDSFPEVLSETDSKVEFKTGETCYIRTTKGQKVVRRGQTVSQSLRSKTKDYLQRLEMRGIIRRTRSDWRNPIIALEKPNGDVRIVSNHMGLNDLVEKDPYQLPTIREVIQATQGSMVFSVIDLKEGFYHIEIEEKHKHKTAFEYDGSVYEWNSMVMGFKNAPQIMQRTMNKILGDWRGEGVEVYMDDIVIHAKTGSRHDELFTSVMKRFREHRLKVNPKKIQFRKEEVDLLGVKIDGYNKRPSEITRNEALEFKKPETVKELRRFLGLAGWFREFIKNFDLITTSLFEALKTNKKWNWTKEMDDEFNLVKEE
ncbi:Transposon Tf2-6 polyprotein, partial [Nosema granulosis]